MFSINPIRKVTTNLPEITNNYLELLSDENPILFTGTNSLGNRILGVIVGESDDDFSIRYFHVIIEDRDYYKFIGREITLRKLIEKSEILFVIDCIGETIKEKFLLPFSEIPQEYLPLNNSYCPEIAFSPSFDFGISLKGKISELHLVIVSDVNKIQTAFEGVLKHVLDIIKDFSEVVPKTYLQPATTGSYRVNYKLEFERNADGLFALQEDKIAAYVNAYLDYVFIQLPKEKDFALNEEDITSKAFKALEGHFLDMINASSYDINKLNPEQRLIDSISQSALKLEQIADQIKLSNSFDRIEVINYQIKNAERSLGLIDSHFFDNIKLKLPPLDEDTSELKKDTTYKIYWIRVYSFNNKTGNCWAELYPDPKGEESYKIPIRIKKGDKSYKNSVFTTSLDDDSVIKISGLATWKGDKVKEINTQL